jgi:hypothetical protein
MPTEIFLPDCVLQCYQYLYPTLDFSRIHFYDGIPAPFSAGPETGITLTYGFGTGIHVHMQSGLWDPCNYGAFLIFAHELVHVLQIKNLPSQMLWPEFYLRTFIAHGFQADCTNTLEEEAYTHVNGCDPLGGGDGDLGKCIAAWNPSLVGPCDCSTKPIYRFSTFPPGSSITFLDMLEMNCSKLVKSESDVPYRGSILTWIGATIVAILGIPLSSSLGFWFGVGGVVVGIILAILLIGFSPWLVLGILAGIVAGWLVGGLLGSLISWIGGLFSGPSNNLIKAYIEDDGSGGTVLGGFATNSTPFVAADGFVYFQGTDNTVWKVDKSSGSGTTLGGFKANSMPYAATDGFVYFQGTDNTLWRVNAMDGTGASVQGYKTNSPPCVPGDGFVYFQGIDNKLWKVPTTGSGGTNLGGWQTSSTPFVASDGFVYFQGTDDTLWRVNSADGSGDKVQGYKTKSPPYAPGDGYVYFQGTDDKLWQVLTTGSGGTNLGGFKTNSSPFVSADGFVYFQGTDNAVWKVSAADGSGRRIAGFNAASTPIAPGDHFAYFRSA